MLEIMANLMPRREFRQWYDRASFRLMMFSFFMITTGLILTICILLFEPSLWILIYILLFDPMVFSIPQRRMRFAYFASVLIILIILTVMDNNGQVKYFIISLRNALE